jgi:uncharacterized protein (TIGR02246 family)
MSRSIALLGIQTGFFALVTTLVLAAPVSAQLRPGIERGDYWGEVRARYRSEVLADVGLLIEAWLEAWNNKDYEGLLETYSEDAQFLVDTETFKGTERLRDMFPVVLARLGPINTGLQDFDVSSDLAFATMTYQYVENEGTRDRRQVSGLLVWVLVKHTGEWKIRSQIFRPSSQ